MGSRGQISIFIIIGILLLMGAAGYFVMRHTTILQPEENTLSSIPSELEPVRQYVHTCLYNVGLEGLKIAASQGGYIDPVAKGITFSQIDYTSGEGIKMSPASSMLIPYYYYMSSDNECRNNCFFTSELPSLTGGVDSVQAQVEEYIETHMDACLNGFSGLREFEVSEQGEPNVDLVFTDDRVSLLLTYPLLVTAGDRQVIVNDYEATIDVPFRKMYDYAVLITAASVQHKFLERQVLEIISLYSGVDKDKLPPVSAYTFEVASGMFWIKTKVNEQIKGLMISYIPGLQVYNSKNMERIVYKSTEHNAVQSAVQRIYDNMVLPIENPGYNDLAVEFEYLGWPYYLSLNSRSEVIRPDSYYVEFIPMFGMQRFHTMYDVSFPVKVSIMDEEALGGLGFTYNFALEGNIRNNDPMNSTFNQSQYESEAVEMPLFCRFEQRNSGNISLSVVDGKNNSGVAGASMLYECGDISCMVSLSDARGKINEPFPVCKGGRLKVSKFGYLSTSVPLSTTLDVPVDLGAVTLEPLRTKTLLLDKVPVIKVAGKWQVDDVRAQNRNFADIDPSEYAIATFELVDGDYQTIVQVDNSGRASVDLVPGSYKVQVDLFSKKNLVIEPDKREEDDETYYVPEERITIDTVPVGGRSANANSSYIIIGKSDLDSSDIIELPIIGIDYYGLTKPVIEDLEQMQKITFYSQNYSSLMNPSFMTEEEYENS